MSKLWKKSSTKTHPLIERYTVGEDYLLDMKLLPYDIQASKAHAKGLQRIGVLTTAEFNKLSKALDQFAKLHQQGKVKIRIQDEDGHTVMENYLVENCGDAGKKIHTGRSRNDQVLVALRLYQKDQLQEICAGAKTLADSFLHQAKKHQWVALPGYTHTQQAMLSSVGHWMASFAESLIDDLSSIEAAQSAVDKNPLGSAAGFGVSIALDRAFTTKELGFNQLQINSLYCQASKGKLESMVLEALLQVMLTLGRFANDMLMFTTQEFDFFEVDSSLLTGSSIMPQKKNHDALEILRGNLSRLMANKQLILDLSKGLISGYNRDLQLLKRPLMDSFDILRDSLEVVGLYLEHMKPNKKAIEQKISPGIFAADIANQLVKEEGMAFRDAYRVAMDQLETQDINHQKNLRSKVSAGAPGNLRLEELRKRLKNY